MVLHSKDQVVLVGPWVQIQPKSLLVSEQRRCAKLGKVDTGSLQRQ
jgi:hypothetical protein